MFDPVRARSSPEEPRIVSPLFNRAALPLFLSPPLLWSPPVLFDRVTKFPVTPASYCASSPSPEDRRSPEPSCPEPGSPASHRVRQLSRHASLLLACRPITSLVSRHVRVRVVVQPNPKNPIPVDLIYGEPNLCHVGPPVRPIIP